MIVTAKHPKFNQKMVNWVDFLRQKYIHINKDDDDC